LTYAATKLTLQPQYHYPVAAWYARDDPNQLHRRHSSASARGQSPAPPRGREALPSPRGRPPAHRHLAPHRRKNPWTESGAAL